MPRAQQLKSLKFTLIAIGALGLSACAGGAYTGPVEVTRFVAEQPDSLGQGTIALRFSEDLKNEAALDAFRAAVGNELGRLGYTVIDNAQIAGQIATITTSRTAVEAATRGRSPVSVGVGGSTGTFGTGGGLGVGINLGGSGSQSPRVVSQLRVAIADTGEAASAQNLWEARAQFPTSVDSPFAPIEVNAQTLAAALFNDFPGGNGETVTLDAAELVEP